MKEFSDFIGRNISYKTERRIKKGLLAVTLLGASLASFQGVKLGKEALGQSFCSDSPRITLMDPGDSYYMGNAPHSIKFSEESKPDDLVFVRGTFLTFPFNVPLRFLYSDDWYPEIEKTVIAKKVEVEGIQKVLVVQHRTCRK